MTPNRLDDFVFQAFHYLKPQWQEKSLLVFLNDLLAKLLQWLWLHQISSHVIWLYLSKISLIPECFYWSVFRCKWPTSVPVPVNLFGLHITCSILSISLCIGGPKARQSIQICPQECWVVGDNHLFFLLDVLMLMLLVIFSAGVLMAQGLFRRVVL